MAAILNETNSWQNEGLSMNLTYLCMGGGRFQSQRHSWQPFCIPKLVFVNAKIKIGLTYKLLKYLTETWWPKEPSKLLH